jgi:diguanylate cyclase (GGDEF)-like protein
MTWKYGNVAIDFFEGAFLGPSTKDMIPERRREAVSTEPPAEPSSLREARTTLATLRAENEALRAEVDRLREFRTLAYRDPLTGLWNRRFFQERLDEELSRAQRKAGYTFSVLIADVNDLKTLNDQEGHAAGDALLAWVAGFLRQSTRAHDLCCRLGGDEFAIILPDAAAACRDIVADRLRAQLAVENAGRDRPVGLSFGGATCPDHGLTPEELLEPADAAMYADKERQKGRATRRTPLGHLLTRE